MPIHKVPGGWRWGESGKIYPTKKQALKQARAIYASGYTGKFNKSNNSKDLLEILYKMMDWAQRRPIWI